MKNEEAEKTLNALIIAKKEKVKIENQILAYEQGLIQHFKFTKEEGSQTFTMESGAKIEIKGGLNYKADLEAIENIFVSKELPKELLPIKTKKELDDTGAKWIRKNRADIWKLLSEAIETKPAKTSVTIKQ